MVTAHLASGVRDWALAVMSEDCSTGNLRCGAMTVGELGSALIAREDFGSHLGAPFTVSVCVAPHLSQASTRTVLPCAASNCSRRMLATSHAE